MSAMIPASLLANVERNSSAAKSIKSTYPEIDYLAEKFASAIDTYLNSRSPGRVKPTSNAPSPTRAMIDSILIGNHSCSPEDVERLRKSLKAAVKNGKLTSKGLSLFQSIGKQMFAMSREVFA